MASSVLTYKNNWADGYGAYLHDRNNPARYVTGDGVDCSSPYKVILSPKQNLLTTGTSTTPFCFGEHRVSGTTSFYIGGNGSGNRKIFRLKTWSTTPAVDTVYDVAGTGQFWSIQSFGGYIFAAGTPYVYSASGDLAGWTASTLAGDWDDATYLLALRDTLHKLYGTGAASHAQVSAVAAALNAGAGWSSADALNDGTIPVHGLAGFSDGIAFFTERGPVQMDYAGNIVPLNQEMVGTTPVNSGYGADVWRGRIYFPTEPSALYVFGHDIGMVNVTPGAQQQRRLESPVDTLYSNMVGRIHWVKQTHHALYALMATNDSLKLRLLKCVETEGRHVWHTSTLFVWTEYGSFVPGYSQDSTSGPVLWTSYGSTSKVAYVILPTVADPEQDSRCTYETTGTLYEPWDDGGAPDKLKLWDKVMYWSIQPTSTTLKLKVVADNGQTILPQQAVEEGYHSVRLPPGAFYRRIRVEWELGTTVATSTPVLNAYALFGEPVDRED